MKGFVISIIIFLVFILGLFFGDIKYRNNKQEGAMEVYRGNTKLQYTIVDSVKVDSCVIFLNK